MVGYVSSIEHLSTLSDPHLVVVEINGNVPVPPIRAAVHQPYWKLNSKILQVEDFEGNFGIMLCIINLVIPVCVIGGRSISP